MAQTTTCEHCGAVTDLQKAERLVFDGWTHDFCFERCKIQWGEQTPVEDEE